MKICLKKSKNGFSMSLSAENDLERVDLKDLVLSSASTNLVDLEELIKELLHRGYRGVLLTKETQNTKEFRVARPDSIGHCKTCSGTGKVDRGNGTTKPCECVAGQAERARRKNRPKKGVTQ